MNQANLSLIAVVTTLAMAGLTLTCIRVGFAQEAVARQRHRVIFDVPLREGQLRHEMIGTLIFHAVFLSSLVLLWWKYLEFEVGWRADVITFFVCLYSFQIYYYWFHRAMHSEALYRFHKWHHHSHVMTPVAGLSMGPVEAIGWTVGLLAPLVALSHWHVLGAWGLIVFLAFHWYGNVTGHANADFIPKIFGSKLATTFVNPVTYHALHHARFKGHYGFGAAYMDRLGHTEFADWQNVHARVMAGEPLTRMSETVD